MAEQVQFILERMVLPLKDLRTRGLFTPTEIRAIVERRRQSEYLMQRRSAARKSDYLRYIEHEIMLERLRKLRKEKVLMEMKNENRRRLEQEDEDDSNDGDHTRNHSNKKHAYQTSGPGDSHILAHIHFLYQRTLKKFHYPLDIVLNYAQFSKEHKSFQMLSRIYAEGLQFHPRESGLWIEAASFEYFGYVAQDYENGKTKEVHSKVVGSSIQNARVLMQRGLRINKTSVDLWLQYFSLELHYVQKLRGRREILGNGGDEEDEEEGEKISASLLPSQIIFKNAIKAISDDIQFRLRFVEACRMFPKTKALEECIMKSVTEDFGTSVEGWVARISYAEEQSQKKMRTTKDSGSDMTGFLGEAVGESHDNNSGSEDDTAEAEGRLTKKARVESESKTMNDPALILLQEALEAVPTPKMYLECARFLRLRTQRLLDASEGNDDEDEDVSHLIGKEEDAKGAAQRHAHLLEALYENANKVNASSTNLTLDHVDFLLSSGQHQNAEQLLSSAVATEDVNDARLWLRWADISQRMEAAASDTKVPASSSPTRILRRALQCTPLHDRQAHTLILAELMHHLMMQSSPSLKASEELKSLFQKMILLSQGSNYSMASVKKSDEDEEDEEEKVVNLASTFNDYLKYTILNSATEDAATEGNDAPRSIYTSVIYHSNYGKACSGKTEEELVTMKSFFDLCVEFEIMASNNKTSLIGAGSTKTKKDRKEKKKASKMRLCKLYQAAIGFYESGGGDSVWMRNVVDGYQRNLEDVKYSF
mmetsp:Transcript_20083/g.43581  ORF Transcript_20083/g.43581 Transcript_20083/m.43581 type:complete len:765 (+) Transcript_20083:204-2498(+)|eukprot:CAMPEP_0172315986 /NCGR_PEP_ID=MMETSP1058-20130122/26862_1 /TAXON_ID=83371 /ORGANISM="Detonula confervacea, Strain CCMP 353" /LENGTH=764 /DNA_ID=CAMNT_0013030201 /DNA_START=122 /DNA_END=2416 /DNA_ORIENTATION=+